MRKRLLISLGIAILLITSVTIPIMASHPDPVPAEPIANDWYPPQMPPHPIPNGYDLTPKFIGNPATPNPIPHVPIPQHQFTSDRGNVVMHSDSWSSSTYEFGGPLGENPQHYSAKIHGLFDPFDEPMFNIPMTIVIDKRGRVVCSTENMSRAPRLLMMDPDTLDLIATYQLPGKTWDWQSDPLGTDTAGGAYCFLDHKDRMTVATNDATIDLIKVKKHGFQLKKSVDISHLMYDVPDPSVSRDLPTSILPDCNKKNRIWFTSRYGRVGYVDLKKGTGAYYEALEPEPGVDRELFQNSLAVADDGVYVVSDYAMYRVNECDGEVVVDWRTPYDKGTRLKPGLLSLGSGTTPTLTGEFVIIADNADPQINVLIYDRDTGELVGSEDAFEGHDNASACEVSVVAFQHAALEDDDDDDEGDDDDMEPIDKHSIIITNQYGYDRADFSCILFGNMTESGVTRIDIEKIDGAWTTSVVWDIQELNYATIPKLSFENGLLYLSTKDAVPLPPPYPPIIDAWYLTAVDFNTGETVYKTLMGTGFLHNDYGSPVTISPDGVVYIGAVGGMNAIRDGG